MLRDQSLTIMLAGLLLTSFPTWGADANPFFPKTHPKESPKTHTAQPADLPTDGLAAMQGTWKQVGQDTLYWTIRADGAFRVHGVFMGRPYRGKMQALGGSRFKVVTTDGSDEITATLKGNELHTDGRLGQATWLPLWRPTSPSVMRDGDKGACDALPVREVASVLSATLEAPRGKAMKNGRALEGCKYRSSLSRNDRVELILVGGPFTFNQARDRARNKLPLTGLAYDGFAELENGILTAHVLRGEVHLRVVLRLEPGATADDLALINRLAKLAAQRLRPEWV